MGNTLNSAEKKLWQWRLPHDGSVPLKSLGLTIVTLFYNDVERLDRMFNLWKSYTDDIKNSVYVVIVDDCSKVPIHKTIEKRKSEIDFNLTIYRVKENLKWNMPGAWNLGISKASTDWVVNVASDCCFDVENMTKMLTLRPREEVLYKFYRKRITNNPNPPNLRGGQPHSEVYLQQKKTFLKIGGFDEDFTGERSGGYASFEVYFAEKFTRMGIHYGCLEDVEMIEYLEDVTGGSVQLAENVSHDSVKINKILMRAKLSGKVPEYDKTKMIRFEWEKVFEAKR